MKRFSIERFRRDESGAVLLENILWIPFMLFFMLMVLDASLIFMNYARAQRIVHEGNRAFITGELASCNELEDWLETELRTFIPSATASCGTSLSITAVSVSMTTGDMDLTGATGFLGGMTISVGGLQTFEYVPSG